MRNPYFGRSTMKGVRDQAEPVSAALLGAPSADGTSHVMETSETVPGRIIRKKQR